MELFDWSNIHLNYAPITFWYMLPGGEIQPKPFVSDVRERVANQPSDIFGSGMSLVVEGEVMQPRPGHMGSVELQTNFHPLWSEGMQLYWKEFKPGDKLSLVLTVKWKELIMRKYSSLWRLIMVHLPFV